MTKRIGLQVGFAGSPAEREEIVKRVQIAEDLGVESVWVAEAWGRDAFSMLTQLAERTTRVQLGTAIVNIYSRTPAALAQHFATLDELLATVEACFDRWQKPNPVLRKLCGIV